MDDHMHNFRSAKSCNTINLLKGQSCVVLFMVLAVSSVGFAASQLTFDENGVPTSLVLNGTNRLHADQSSSGFFLRTLSGKSTTETALQHVEIKGNVYTVSESGGLPRFTFRVDNHPRYVSFHMLKIEGVDDWSTSLALRMNATVDLGSLWADNGKGNRTINKWTKAFDHMVEIFG